MEEDFIEIEKLIYKKRILVKKHYKYSFLFLDEKNNLYNIITNRVENDYGLTILRIINNEINLNYKLQNGK